MQLVIQGILTKGPSLLVYVRYIGVMKYYHNYDDVYWQVLENILRLDLAKKKIIKIMGSQIVMFHDKKS